MARFWPGRSLRIFLALVAGLALGTLMARGDAATLETVLAVAQPVGRMWLAGLTMTVVPLVFALLVTGIAGAAEHASAGAVARRALLWFAVLLVSGSAAGTLLTSGLIAVWPIAASEALIDAAPGAGAVIGAVDPASDWVAGIIPSNPIKAAADMAMVPLVVFALLFGFAMARIAEPLRQSLLTFFQAIVETMLTIVQWVLFLAPVGVFALSLAVGARLGVGAAWTLLHYVAIVSASCIIAGVLATIVAITIGRISPRAFLRAAFPAQVVAVSTQSSLASLPAMIDTAPALGVDREAAGVVLPLAVSIFRVTSAPANIAVAIYLANLHGVALSVPTLAVTVVIAAAISVASVGLPGQVSFFATIVPVCAALGVPVTLLPVLLAVESLPDIFRTLGNVTADLAVARLAGRSSSGG